MQPKAGDNSPLAIQAREDAVSGRLVERLTDNSADFAVTYFTKEMFTPDNHGVLVASNRTGEWLPYMILPDDRVMRCLSTTPMNAWSSPAIGGERVIFVSKEGQLGFVPLGGGEFTPVFQLPPDRHWSEVSASSCGRYAVMTYMEKTGPTTQRISDGSFPSSGSEGMAYGPRSVVLWVDLDTGISKGITGANAYLAHAMLSPIDPHLIEYCNALPWSQTQRMWTARYFPEAMFVDVQPLFRQKPGIDAVGHEFFLQDGRLAAIWLKYTKVGAHAHEPSETFLLIADPRTRKSKAFRTPGLLFNHLHGRDGKVSVSEGRSSVALKKALTSNPHELDLLCRYDVKGERAKATVLCVHGSSWKGQLGHPHAVVCRENKHCYFNSDRDGHCNVYRVRM